MDFVDVIGFEATHTPIHVFAFRMGFAAVLGGVIGYERELHHRAAGLRTHILVAVAAALFMILGTEMFEVVQARDDNPTADLLRVIEAVTTGVAFLGAGTIFMSNGSVRGLTTGAGMWLAGAVGLAVGLGHYIIALIGAVIAVITLAVLVRLSHHTDRRDEDTGRSD